MLDCRGRWACLAALWAIAGPSFAQQDTTIVTDGRACRSCLVWTGAGAGVAAAGALLALDQAWYAQYDRGPFHSFDDSREWLQMDKTGHLMSCYAVGSWGHAMMRNCGAGERSSRYLGGSVGLLFMTGIELLDGTSSGWGFSWSDMAANAAGAGLFMAQDALWSEQRIVPKISAHHTVYAARRPDLLGEGFADRLLKDYNGVTLWLSFNLKDLSGAQSIPPWLNVAAGYGAEGLISAHPNLQDPSDPAYRQFYLSPDIDLSRIRSRSKAVRTLLFLANSLKVPMPALEWRSDGVLRGHWLYF
ncbi:MAG: DUF2279 domain-containing protein [Flavobacteriales bacterium]|nr:DUF2279 domain-containing protein [Flavobacteriales bacterium]